MLADDSTQCDDQMPRENTLQRHPTAAQGPVTTMQLSQDHLTAADCNTPTAVCNT